MNDALGLKVRMTEPMDPAGYKRAGEDIAAYNRGRAREVWVWVYAHDMDLMGPAVCMSYVSEHVGPITEFVNPALLTAYYSGSTSPGDWN